MYLLTCPCYYRQYVVPELLFIHTLRETPLLTRLQHLCSLFTWSLSTISSQDFSYSNSSFLCHPLQQLHYSFVIQLSSFVSVYIPFCTTTTLTQPGCFVVCFYYMKAMRNNTTVLRVGAIQKGSSEKRHSLVIPVTSTPMCPSLHICPTKFHKSLLSLVSSLSFLYIFCTSKQIHAFSQIPLSYMKRISYHRYSFELCLFLFNSMSWISLYQFRDLWVFFLIDGVDIPEFTQLLSYV